MLEIQQFKGSNVISVLVLIINFVGQGEIGSEEGRGKL